MSNLYLVKVEFLREENISKIYDSIFIYIKSSTFVFKSSTGSKMHPER